MNVSTNAQKPTRAWLRIARRELAGGIGGFWIFLACLALGAWAIAAAGSITSSYNAGLDRQSHELLGGDAAVTLVQRAATLGARMVEDFKCALAGNKAVTNVRGHGLMLGIELDRGCYDLVKLALAHGLLINVTADKTVRLLPPLILSDDEARQIVERVCALINDFTAGAA